MPAMLASSNTAVTAKMWREARLTFQLTSFPSGSPEVASIDV